MGECMGQGGGRATHLNSNCIRLLRLLFHHAAAKPCQLTFYKRQFILYVVWIYFKITCMLSRFNCVLLCDPRDCSPPGSSVHGILQTRILEWVAISFSRGSSRPRDRTHVSYVYL